jgi:hypothetical protein
MTGYSNTRKRKKVRASVIRRTVVGSLVVMLSPFLMLLEQDADASFQAPKPVIYNSMPAVERSLPVSVPLDGLSLINDIESSLRSEAQSYWIYENVNPEG